MTDLLDSIGGGLGKAFDFVAPSTERRGAGFGFGDLVNDLADTVKNTAVGGLSMADDVLLSDASWKQKLFVGGLAGVGLAGTFAGARSLAAASSIERQLADIGESGAAPAMRRWGPKQGALGLEPRSNVETPGGSLVVRQHPGIKPRTADILGAPNTTETAMRLASPLVRAAEDPTGGYARIASFIDLHASSLTDVEPQGRLGAAQLDFAKLDTAVDNGIIGFLKDPKKEAGRANAGFVELWGRFRNGDLDPSSPDGQQFANFVRAFSDATNDVVEPDLSFDPVAKISGVDFLEDGRVLVKVEIPRYGNPDQVFFDAEERSRRIRELNLRPLAARGKEIMMQLYREGIEDGKIRAGKGMGKPKLSRGLKRGSGWYQLANSEIDQALADVADIPWVASADDGGKSILTAAVSLTSEGADWEDNVGLATSVLRAANTPEVMDPEFQAWLRTVSFPKGKIKYEAGPRAAEHLALFDRVFQTAKVGNKIDQSSLSKVLRLAAETPEDLFRSTTGKKQKNFYLNLLDPSDTGPVTIDRHMHDVFLGLASSSDFKLLEMDSLSDSNYDVIADVLREAADELDVTPNELQGVVWETWKIKKDDYRNFKGSSDPWGNRDPFRIPEPDGSENQVFKLLKGELGLNVTDALSRKPDRLMVIDAATDTRGLAIIDDELNVWGPQDVATAVTYRTFRPALDHTSGAAMYGPSRPLPVQDVEQVVRRLEADVPDHQSTTWSDHAWGPEGHPATRNGTHVLVNLPDGPVKRDIRELGGVVEPSMRAGRVGPLRSQERLRYADIDPVMFSDPERSPLVTHEWASIESAPPPKDADGLPIPRDPVVEAAKFNRLVAELRDEGYDPIVQEGFYKDGDTGLIVQNPSVLVMGLPVERAVEYGRRYGQQSIAAPGGLFYMDGTVDPADGIKFGIDPSKADGGSTTTIAGRTDSWTLTGLSWMDAEMRPSAATYSPRANRPVRQVAVKLTNMADLGKLEERVKAAGGSVDAVYASTPAVPPGYKLGREHLFNDGISTVATRSLDTEISSVHGYHAFFPKAVADGLPKKNPLGARVVKEPQIRQVPGGFVANGAVAVALPEGAVNITADLTKIRLNGAKPSFVVLETGPNGIPTLKPGWGPVPEGAARIEAGGRFALDLDPSDVTPGAAWVDALGQLGVPEERLRVNIGMAAIGASHVDIKPERGKVTTILNEQVPALRKTSTPLPGWIDKYGVWFDPAWRDPANPGKVLRADDRFLDEFDAVMDQFMKYHGENARLMGFHRMGFNPELPDDTFAQFTWGADGAEIQINPKHMSSPDAVFTDRVQDINTNRFSPNLPPTFGAVIAHELGHMVHHSLRRSFWGTGQANEFDKKVLNGIKRRLGGGKAVERQVSRYANTDLQEFMAESLAEAMFSDQPRPVALDVYKTVMDQFAKNQAARRTASRRTP